MVISPVYRGHQWKGNGVRAYVSGGTIIKDTPEGLGRNSLSLGLGMIQQLGQQYGKSNGLCLVGSTCISQSAQRFNATENTPTFL